MTDRKLLVALAPILLVVVLTGCVPFTLENGTSSNSTPGVSNGTIDNPGGKLLVVKDGAIWLLKDGNFKALAKDAKYACPVWSPDGKQIVAAVVGQNHSDLVLLNETGVRSKQLTNNWATSSIQDCAWVRSPSWSSDGLQIAYATDIRGSHTETWVLEAKTGKNVRSYQTPSSISDVDYLAWSPDGQQLAVTGFSGFTGQIFVVDVQTGRWTQLTDSDHDALQPAWSPDGKKIAFVMRTNGESDIWVMNSDGSQQTALTKDGTANAPAWSPGGNIIAYLAGRPSSDLYITGATPSSTPGKGRSLTSGGSVETPSRISWTK